MFAYIVLVSNGPTVVITTLPPEKTVANLIWREFRDFNLYQIHENQFDELRKDIGSHTWDNTASELNDEWPVRGIDRDSSRAFLTFQMFARDAPIAKVRNRKRLEINTAN
jgi:hypothetical protein